MRGAGAGSAENPSRRCRPQSDGKDHLSGRFPLHEGLWHSGTAPAVRGGAEGAGDQSAAGAPRSPSNPQRGFFSGGGIGKIAGIENGLHHRPAPDGPLYGGQYPGLSNLPEICGPRGHSRLFHRRGVHGGHPLSENLPLDRPGAGHADDPGRAK